MIKVEVLLNLIRSNPVVEDELNFRCHLCGATVQSSLVVRHVAWHRDLRSAFVEGVADAEKTMSKAEETVQYSKPVLKQTEIQQECQTCFAVIPQSNMDGHLDWHRSEGHTLKTTVVNQ